MLSLKRALVAACVAGSILFVPTAVFAGTSSGQGAQKQALVDKPVSYCNGLAGGTVTDHSFATLNLDGAGNVTTVVHLQKVNPNDTYYVWTYGEGCYPYLYDGTITTNGQGNGNLSTLWSNPGITAGYVFIYDTAYADSLPNADWLQSPVVPLR